MSIVGFDIGDSKSVIAVARKGGIDIILNESSNRFTPVVLGFGTRQRFLGESAKTQQMTNSKNTISDLIRLVGRSWHDEDLHQVDFKYLPNDFVEHHGQVGVRVEYAGETRLFSAIQLMAMHLAHLKYLAQRELKSAVYDCVIAIPPFFDDAQRRAMLDAGKIAGLNIIHLIHDSTAAAVSQGFYRRDIVADKPITVALVDFGHSSVSASILQFTATGTVIKSTAFDRNFGGRDIDELLARHFADLFQKKHRIDIYSRQKALLRLRAACERLKRVLSANSEAMLSVESIMDDIDVQAMMKRSELETLMAPLLERLRPLFERALQTSGLTEVHEIKMIGGCTRIPLVQRAIAQFFGRDADQTINQDEAVARGCALLCAMHSPSMRVKEYTIQDVTPYAVSLQWGAGTGVEVFPQGHPFPGSKNITLSRAQPFECQLVYTDAAALPQGHPRTLTACRIDGITAPSKIKVKVRLNAQGLVSIESASTQHEEEQQEEEGEKKEGEETAAKKPSVKTVKVTLPCTVLSSHSLEAKRLQQWSDEELTMANADRQLQETLDRRNALEQFIYATRDQLESELRPYADREEAEALSRALSDAEMWLEEDGANDDSAELLPKGVYVGRLADLRKLADPVAERHREHTHARPEAVRALRDVIEGFRRAMQSVDYAHLETREKERALAECVRVEQWLDTQLKVQAALPLHQVPVLMSSHVLEHMQTLNNVCAPLLRKTKPREEPRQKTETAAEVDIEETGSDAAEQEIPIETTTSMPEVTVNMED